MLVNQFKLLKLRLHERTTVYPFEIGTSHDYRVMGILSVMMMVLVMMNNVQHHHDVMTFCRTRDQWKRRKKSPSRGEKATYRESPTICSVAQTAIGIVSKH
ncbi:hypothetical protein V6Z92_005072 [Aspergillus fumigatus]